MAASLMVNLSLPSTVQAAPGDPLPHAPLPAYQYNHPKPTITINTADASDLTTWMNTQVAPLLMDWYPVIGDVVVAGNDHITCFPTAGTTCPPAYVIPSNFTIKSDATYTGLAYTTTTAGVRTIVFNPAYARANQANMYGVFIHEMTHVVQVGAGSPYWFTEGLADYVRYFVYKDFTPTIDLNGTYLNGYGNAALLINHISAIRPDYPSAVQYRAFLGTYTPATTTALTNIPLEQHWKNLTGHSITTINNLKPGNALTRCIDLPNFATADGTRPDIWDCVAQENVRWVATDQDKATGGFIQGYYGVKCLRVNTAIPSNGGFGVDYRGCSATDANEKFLRRADGTVYNAATNKCLRPVSSGSVNGTKLEVVTCNAAQSAQKWTWSLAI